MPTPAIVATAIDGVLVVEAPASRVDLNQLEAHAGTMLLET